MPEPPLGSAPPMPSSPRSPQVPGRDHRRSLIPLVDDQVGIIEGREFPGLFGHRREDLGGRRLAGDQRGHAPQCRLLVGQYAPGLF
jgi:hypothetical protein